METLEVDVIGRGYVTVMVGLFYFYYYDTVSPNECRVLTFQR